MAFSRFVGFDSRIFALRDVLLMDWCCEFYQGGAGIFLHREFFFMFFFRGCYKVER